MSLADKCSSLPVASRRMVALVAVPLAVVLTAYLAVQAIQFVFDVQQDWRSEARSAFAQVRGAEQIQVRLDQDLLALSSSPLWSRFYSPATAGAGATLLQGDVGSLLSAVQSSAQSLTPMPSVPMAEFTKIGVRLTASMRINQLKSFLAAAASHQHYLRVEQLTVVAPQMQIATENPPLAVTMDVYGFELAAGRVADSPAGAAIAMRSNP